jgi:hypothetical protein
MTIGKHFGTADRSPVVSRGHDGGMKISDKLIWLAFGMLAVASMLPVFTLAQPAPSGDAILPVEPGAGRIDQGIILSESGLSVQVLDCIEVCASDIDGPQFQDNEGGSVVDLLGPEMPVPMEDILIEAVMEDGWSLFLRLPSYDATTFDGNFVRSN